MKSDQIVFQRVLELPYFSENHTLRTFNEDNILERKVNLLKLINSIYRDLSSLEVLFIHRPIIVMECLKKLFPKQHVNLNKLEEFRWDCSQMIQLALPHCLEMSKVGFIINAQPLNLISLFRLRSTISMLFVLSIPQFLIFSYRKIGRLRTRICSVKLNCLKKI